jgi:hypothetical protein
MLERFLKMLQNSIYYFEEFRLPICGVPVPEAKLKIGY